MGENLKKLNIEIKIPYVLTLDEGVKIKADVLVESFGEKKGMLLFSFY